MLKVETYLITWNREDTIHLTVQHYLQYGKVTVYDNYSTDNTRRICTALGANVKMFGLPDVLSDQEYLTIKNHCWKGSQADLVIVCDDDEILIPEFEQGATIYKTQGFSMFSNDVPHETFLEINTGYKDNKYSKLVMFDPKEITEIGYVYGCHEANPKGNIRWSVGTSNLYHYNGIGGAQRMIDRHVLYEQRRLKSPVNVRWGLGKEYGYSSESKRIWFKEQLEKSEVLFVDGGH